MATYMYRKNKTHTLEDPCSSKTCAAFVCITLMQTGQISVINYSIFFHDGMHRLAVISILPQLHANTNIGVGPVYTIPHTSQECVLTIETTVKTAEH